MAKRRRANGEASVFATEKNGRRVWCAELRGEKLTAKGRPRVRRAYRATQAQALAELEAWRQEKVEHPDFAPGHATVADLAELYLESKGRSVAATTLATYRHSLDHYLTPADRLGNVKLAKLTSAHVLRWLAQLDATAPDPAKGLRARQMAFDMAKRLFAFGVKPAKQLRSNPCEGIDRPKAPKPEVEALLAEEARALLAKARETSPPWVEAAVALGLCGLRRAEVFGLDWRHVDLDGGTVRVEQSYPEPTKGPAALRPPKSKAGRRAVPLTPQAVDALARYRVQLGATPHPTRAVFATEHGSRILGSNFFAREFKPLTERSGLPDCTFHMLRHTTATLYLGAGVDVKSVQSILGHSKASMTLDLYGHAIPSKVETAGVALGHALAGTGK